MDSVTSFLSNNDDDDDNKFIIQVLQLLPLYLYLLNKM